MRASILVMGPLLARFGRAHIPLPGGCAIGERPIDYHVKALSAMGVMFDYQADSINAVVSKLTAQRIILSYPSVGATENILMVAALTPGITTIINASLEPEVLDLIAVLQAMGAQIAVSAPATIAIEGVQCLKPITHTVMMDRLETGCLLLAAAITGGSIYLPQACTNHLEVFLGALQEMGHTIVYESPGVRLIATQTPHALSLRTSPYPGFPTDLQAPMMAALCLAQGKSSIHETVFENRFLHVQELKKMGAQITISGDRACINGVEQLYGATVIASDIRASCALVLAGLAAQGTTIMLGLDHWRRGYEHLEYKLQKLGAKIELKTSDQIS
jgi:UDP-N-acetylglucosamine 1-carboxyvinyltransferase